ncbi:MAG: type fimbrial biosis protein PilY1, partial [Verrucomicrobiaceae bacterium]|nr:type fimbrial biosis protein PilY1 [Verrucomicrobiaceae bacterium]
MAPFIISSPKTNLVGRSRLRLWAFAIILGLSTVVTWAAVPIAQTFFIPFPETDFQASLKAIDTTGTPVGNSLKTIIAIVVPTAGTVMVYDHWEDGYEAAPGSPVQASTQIWGDGNLSNGTAPGYPTDILPAGAVITLNNNIPMPRSAATILYDGRDRLSSTQAVAVTRAGWAIAPGTVLASSTEVYDTRKWGTSFEIPVGTDTSTQQQFEYTSLHIVAAQDGTVVQVDKDGNGTVDVTRTLNLGDTMTVSGGILSGATVTASNPVEVHELTGDIGSSYESRTFAIRPTGQWASSYFAPVGTTLASEVHNIYLFNPGASTITVSYETTTGTGTFNITANGNYEFRMPMNSGAHFYTVNDAPFYAVGANDAGGAAASNQTHDWGYALLPETALTTSVVTSWAPGSDDLAAPLCVPDKNGSAVWVTPTSCTTVYVYFSG